MTASEIIDSFIGENRFASITEFAKVLDAPLSTVSSWRSWNQIPAWRQPRILELAVQMNVPLSTADFPAPDDRVKAA